MSNPPTTEELDALVRQASARQTRRSFLAAAAAAASGYGLYRWIDTSPGEQGLPRPLRKTLDANTAVTKAVFNDRGLSPTYPLAKAVPLRTNGDYGLKDLIAPENYRLQVTGLANPKNFTQYTADVTAWDYKFKAPTLNQPGVEASTKEAPKAPMPKAFQDAFAALKQKQGTNRPRGQEEAGKSDTGLDSGTPGLLLTMADLRKLPHHELVTEFKCIEGWSQITHWGGYSLAEFIDAYPRAERARRAAEVRLHGDT